jgi:hypothetical protein
LKAYLSHVADFVRDNPVVALDIAKYTVALLIVFGLPIPPGVDVVLAALVVSVLSAVTHKLVSNQIDSALNSPVPVTTAPASVTVPASPAVTPVDPDATQVIPAVDGP